jgi:hypothetical protein
MLVAIELVFKAAFGYWIVRFLLIFPAAAIGVTLSLRQSRTLVKGSAGRLFFNLALAFVAGWLIGLFCDLLPSELWIVKSVVIGIVGVVSAILFAFILSLSFRRLTAAASIPTA